MTILQYLIQERKYDLNKAKLLIKGGFVYKNRELIFLTTEKILTSDTIWIKESKKWVSRGAEKILHGLKIFNFDIKNKVCIDIGASTGGFTQVLLEKGAKKIYAVDVGYNLLDYKLRINPKIKVMEKRNFKSLSTADFDSPIDCIVGDVSFISLKPLFKIASELLINKGLLLVLIKPQFEASSNLVQTGGVVDIQHHPQIITNLLNFANDYQFKSIGVIPSPILGKKAKNVEYLAAFFFEIN